MNCSRSGEKYRFAGVQDLLEGTGVTSFQSRIVALWLQTRAASCIVSWLDYLLTTKGTVLVRVVKYSPFVYGPQDERTSLHNKFSGAEQRCRWLEERYREDKTRLQEGISTYRYLLFEKLLDGEGWFHRRVLLLLDYIPESIHSLDTVTLPRLHELFFSGIR